MSLYLSLKVLKGKAMANKAGNNYLGFIDLHLLLLIPEWNQHMGSIVVKQILIALKPEKTSHPSFSLDPR
jgi:hypothetical protein